MTTKAELAREILIRKLVDTHVSIQQNNGWGEIYYRSGKIHNDSSVDLMKTFKTYFDVKFEDELEAKDQEIKQLKDELKLLKGGYEDSLNMQKCSNAGFMSKISELETEIKQLKNMENIKKILIEWLSSDEYSVDEATEQINHAKIQEENDLIIIQYCNGVKDIVKIVNNKVKHIS